MTKLGHPTTLGAALLISIACLGLFDIVDSFCSSALVSVSSTSTCQSSNSRFCPPSFLAVSQQRPLLSSRLRAKLDDRDGRGMNLLEPGTYPTIIVDDPPQEAIYQEAIGRTVLWVCLAAIFGAGLAVVVGPETSEEFFAGYMVEQSLSVDNLFVFLLLFEYFRVPLASQDRVLNWGIYGAIVMRAIMIGVGAAALERFHAILLVFAAILVYSSAKTLIPGGDDDDEEDFSENTIVKFSRSLIDSTDNFDGSNFFTIIDGVKKATPLFICMIALEISDVVFAVDSVPAVFGVTSVSFLVSYYFSHPSTFFNFFTYSSAFATSTLCWDTILSQNPLVVFSSNMFAIMGLRSLYTILSKAASDLKYLEPAVGIVLGFIGIKMIAEYFGAEIPTEAALGVVAFFLSGGVGFSILEKGLEDEVQKAHD
jgi:predicted tellurium resistance membrane protein TerC